MSNQSTQNATPSVQVQEIGLPQQASPVQILAIAGAAAGIAAGLVAALTGKKEQPARLTEDPKAFLRQAVTKAQSADNPVAPFLSAAASPLAGDSARGRKARKRARAVVTKDAEKLLKQATTTATDKVNTLIETVKSGDIDLEKSFQGVAQSGFAARLKEFGEEAREIAEQGKMRTADAAPVIAERGKHAAEIGKERLSEVADRARSEFIPNAQQVTEHVSAQAKDTAEHIATDAEKLLNDAIHAADEKRKEATVAVKRGSKETGSLLLWLSLAGILVFTVFLDEDQQKRLRRIAREVFSEARDMYSDMKGA